jgi:hypothetical protein
MEGLSYKNSRIKERIKIIHDNQNNKVVEIYFQTPKRD